jgi:hypothetical protein
MKYYATIKKKLMKNEFVRKMDGIEDHHVK